MGAEGLKTAQTHSEIPITQRQAVSQTTGWLDRLLHASCEIAPGALLQDAAAALLASVSDLVPDAALGVCIPIIGQGRGRDAAQIVIRRSQRPSHSQSPDPTRLFPEFAREWVAGTEDGATVHLASDDEEPFSAGGAFFGLVERLALTVGSAIRHSRSYERTLHGEAEVRGLQAQVIQSEKLASLGQIAAGIVHELNNPLTSIVAYSDYLHKKATRAGTDPADVERLMRINEAAERILRFSRDLIAYSRPSAEVPGPVAIHDVIDRALVFCEHVLDQTGVQVTRKFGSVRLVRGVAGQLTQVFVNLFTNACHAMRDDGGCITIATEMMDAAVGVTIRDEGHGIDSEHMARIFEPFYTTKTDGSGTGLGLSIVRNIVDGHGGRIRVDAHVPRGTVFFLELPIAATEC